MLKISIFLSSTLFIYFTSHAINETFFNDLNFNATSMKMKDNIIQLVGDVLIQFEDQKLFCQEATVNRNTKDVTAIGTVVLDTSNLHIEARKIEMNMKTKKATIYQGFVQSGQVEFEGDVIYRFDEKSYDVINGVYTACTTCPAAWSISAKSIQAQIGGYAKLTHPLFRVADVPIIWLPKLLVPLKSSRSTGLLPPSIGWGNKGGLVISESFFWAISRSQDSTITLKHYTLRGPSALFNYRYVLSPSSYGEFNTGRHFQDQIFSKDPDLNNFRPSKDLNKPFDRWYGSYFHYYDLPDNFVQKTQLNLLGDLRYLRDFAEEIGGHGDSALENRVSLTQNQEDRHLSVDASHYTNLLKTNPLADNRDAVHRFPEIRYSLTEKSLFGSSFLFDFDTNYVHFARSDLSYDDITSSPKSVSNSRDGEFNSGDLIRTGQRLDLKPRLSYPLHLGPYVDILPQISYRETEYFFGIPDQPSLRRGYFRTDLSLRTHIERIYGDLEISETTRYKHEIVPEITATSIPYLDQTKNSESFFGSTYSRVNKSQPLSNKDFTDSNGIQFDYNDRVYDRNLVTFSLTNKLIRREWVDGTPNYQQVGRFVLSQTYDIYSTYQKKEEVRPLSDLAALLEVTLKHFETVTELHYFPYHNVTNTTSKIKFKDGGNFIQADYTYNFPTLSDEVLKLSPSERNEQLVFSVGVAKDYVSAEGNVRFKALPEFRGSYKVIEWSYLLHLFLPGNCWGLTMKHTHVIESNETNVGFNFIFKFDGKSNAQF